MFSHFDTKHAWQTDGRADAIGVAYMRYSLYAVARKNQRARPSLEYWAHNGVWFPYYSYMCLGMGSRTVDTAYIKYQMHNYVSLYLLLIELL